MQASMFIYKLMNYSSAPGIKDGVTVHLVIKSKNKVRWDFLVMYFKPDHATSYMSSSCKQ